MDWPIVVMMVIGIFLLVKVISKIVRLMIGIALIATIFYFVSSLNIAMMIMIL